MPKFSKLLSLPFLVLLVLAAAMSVVSKLAHVYTTQVDIPIEIVTDFDSPMWVERSKKSLRAIVTADGRDLLLYKMGLAPALVVPLSLLTINHRNDPSDEYLYDVSEESLSKAIVQVQNKLTINMIVDTLQTLRVSFTETKRLPVVSDVVVQAADGYMISKPVRLSVDSVDVKAPWAVFDTMSVMRTERVMLRGVRGMVGGSVGLVVPRDLIVKDIPAIRYEAISEPYSEKSFTVPIETDTLHNIRILPSAAVVRMRVPLTIYSTVEAPRVSIDVLRPTRSGFYALRLDEVPNGAVVTSVEPSMVQFFIEK